MTPGTPDADRRARLMRKGGKPTEEERVFHKRSGLGFLGWEAWDFFFPSRARVWEKNWERWRFDMVLGCFVWMVIRFFGGYE